MLAFAFVTLGNTASQADDFRRLSGAQIRTQLAGNVLTDGTHWRETYAPKGKLLIEEMGQAATTGSWRIDDHLCKVRPDILNDCYEVWKAGDRVELRLGQSRALASSFPEKPLGVCAAAHRDELSAPGLRPLYRIWKYQQPAGIKITAKWVRGFTATKTVTQ